MLDVTYRQLLVDCRKPRCKRCRGKPSHGPYWFAEWKDFKTGKTRTKYVGKRLPVEVRDYYANMSEGPWPDNMSCGRVRAAAIAERELAQAEAERDAKARSYATGDRDGPRSYATRDRGGRSLVDLCEKCGRELGEHDGTKCPPSQKRVRKAPRKSSKPRARKRR